MIRILFHGGANACEIFDEYTAYEKLCELATIGRLPIVNVLRGEILPMVTPFLEVGQDANVKSRYRKSLKTHGYRHSEQCLLHHSASSADTGLITALLEHGADVNVADEAGSTPFDWAMRREKRFFPPTAK